MSSPAIGLVFLLVFAVSQGVRDALFANVFQSTSFFLVAILAFGASTLCFASFASLSRLKDFRTLAASPIMFAALNVTTAVAWLSFFFGLKYLEPAVVATLYNGIGPLTVLVLGAFGWIEAKGRASIIEMLCYVGLAGVLMALVFVVLTDRSGISTSNALMQGASLLAVIVGGVTIAISHLFARWFNDHGVRSDTVTGTRFLLALCAATILEAVIGQAAARPPLAAIPLLALAAFAVVTIPTFALQLGIARASPLAVNIVRSLGPVSVFAIQQFDGRLKFSGATLLCIASFCVFAIVASVLRAWNEVKAARAA